MPNQENLSIEGKRRIFEIRSKNKNTPYEMTSYKIYQNRKKLQTIKKEENTIIRMIMDVLSFPSHDLHARAPAKYNGHIVALLAHALRSDQFETHF